MTTEVLLDIELPEHWHAFDDPSQLAAGTAAVAAMLDALAGRTGSATRPRPRLRRVPVDVREHPAEPAPRLQIGGRTALVAPELAALAHAGAMRQRLAQPHFDTPAWLLDATPESDRRVPRYLALLCAEIVQRHGQTLAAGDDAPPAVRVFANSDTWVLLLGSQADAAGAASRLRVDAWFDLGVRFPDWQAMVDAELGRGEVVIAIGAREFGPYTVADETGPDAAPLDPATLQEAAAPTPMALLLAHLDRLLREFAPLFVTLEGTTRELDSPSAIAPELALRLRELWPEQMLVQVQRLLLAERVSVRNLRAIVEAMCDFECVAADSVSHIVVDARLPLQRPPPHPDATLVAEFVRGALRRPLTQSLLRGESRICCWVPENDVEHRLAAGLRGEAAAGEDERRAFLRALHDEIAWSATERAPIFLTCSEARVALRGWLADSWPQASVVAYSELSPNASLLTLGHIGFQR